MALVRAMFVLCVVQAPVSAWADEEVDGGSFESVVRAQRPSRSASEVTIGQDVVQAAPRTGAADVLRLVPGLVASQHSGEGKAHQLFLRGFDAVHGQDVEVNVAGLPVNEVSHLHALGYADVNWLIPDVVREVHVTEGTYRAFQGDFATAGTVRFELGLKDKGLTFAATAGSYNRYRFFAGYRPFDDPETFAALEYTQGDGFGPQRAFGRVSFLSQAAFWVKDLRFRAVVGSAMARFDSPGVVRQDDSSDFFIANGLFQGGSSSRHQVLLGVELPGEGKTTIELYGVLSDLRLRNNFTGFLNDARGDGLEQMHNDALVGAHADHRRQYSLFGAPLRIDLSVGGRRDGITQSQRGYRDSDGVPYRNDVDARITQTALFGWVEVAWQPDRWRFMVGGRADVLGYEVFDALAFTDPRFNAVPGATRAALGVHWGLKANVERAFGESWRVFANYGDGFRSPQARSLADGERAPFVNVRGAEIGAAFERPMIDLRAAAFGSSVADDFFFDHSVGTTVSLGASLRGGVSTTLITRPIQGLVISANATAATARVVSTGALLPYFAPLVGRLDTSYSRGFQIFSESITAMAGLGVTGIGPRPLPFNDFSRAVGLIDLRLSARIRFVEVKLDFQNLLDSRWRDGEFTFVSKWQASAETSLLPSRHFTAGTPRSVFVTLEIHL